MAEAALADPDDDTVMSKRYGTVEERFWREVAPEPNSGCWLWTGPVDHFGYGRFRVGAKKKRVHRLWYERAHGKVPDGLVLRHTCDVPSCVNPDHLIVGTIADNIADMDARGRRSVGEHRPEARLTEDAVRKIRGDDRPHRVIALDYGVSHNVIGRVKRRQDWAHVT